MSSPFRADAGLQVAQNASWGGATGVPGLYYNSTTGWMARKPDNTEFAIGSGGGGSTGNWTFSSGSADLSSGTSMFIGSTGGTTGVATSIVIGQQNGATVWLGSNAGSGTTITKTLNGVFMDATAASAGTTTVSAPALSMRPHYWNGSVDTTYACAVQAIMDSTGPTAHLSVKWNGTEMFQFTNGKAFNLGANSTIGQIAQSATNTTALTIASNVADGTSSIGILLNNTTSLANAGAKLLSLQNAGSEKVYFDKDGTAFLTRLQFIGGGTSIILGGAVNQSVGGFRADSDNSRDLGSSGTQWTQTFCGFYGTRSPGTLASAATITPTQMYHKVSGTTSVSTIATGSLPSGFIGWIALTCTGAVPFATGGNILTAFTATANKTYVFWFDGTNWSVQAAG